MDRDADIDHVCMYVCTHVCISFDNDMGMGRGWMDGRTDGGIDR